MLSDEMTTGSVTTSDADKRAYAARSHGWNIQQKKFKESFPDVSLSASQLASIPFIPLSISMSASFLVPSFLIVGLTVFHIVCPVSMPVPPCTIFQTWLRRNSVLNHKHLHLHPRQRPLPRLTHHLRMIRLQRLSQKRNWMLRRPKMTGLGLLDEQPGGAN